MTKPGLLFVVSGPSGVGKDTILEHFLKRRADCVLSVSATTRQPREGEVDGQSYYFIPRVTFGDMIAAGQMLEYAAYSGNLYGTPYEPVVSQRQMGKNVILEIEVQGALQIRQKCPDAVFVFIMPPNMDSLRQRLKTRGTETDAVIDARMEAAKSEILLAEQYDFIIVNRDIDESSIQLSAIVTAANCQADRMKDIIREVCDHA